MVKVFVSYSYDDDEHKAWVSDLANKLRKNGVDVILDQFEAGIGSDLPLFMEQGLSNSNRVICICSEIYNEKADAGLSGVGYEKRIICSELIKNSSTTWIVPVIRNNKSDYKLPKFLSSLKYISFEDDNKFYDNFYDLLRELHDQSNLPPLGKNPFEQNGNIVGKVNENIQIKRSLFTSMNSNGRVRFNYMSNSGEYIFGSGLYEFRTKWSTRRSDSVYAYSDGLKAIAWANKDFNPEKIIIEDLDFSSRFRPVYPDEADVWVNKNGKILVTKILAIDYEGEQFQWLETEYKILEEIVK